MCCSVSQCVAVCCGMLQMKKYRCKHLADSCYRRSLSRWVPLSLEAVRRAVTMSCDRGAGVCHACMYVNKNVETHVRVQNTKKSEHIRTCKVLATSSTKSGTGMCSIPALRLLEQLQTSQSCDSSAERSPWRCHHGSKIHLCAKNCRQVIRVSNTCV